MKIEIINTGTELMLGYVLNTHQQWLCRELADAGYTVQRQTAVPDTGPAIVQSVSEALGRSDFIIVTGGLGPTSDDLTRELIAGLLGKKLRTDERILEGLRQFFAERKRPMPERTNLQAQVPEGAVVLDNPHGTAPGLAMEVPPGPLRPIAGHGWLVMLPGPTQEMRPMFQNHALPLLEAKFPLEAGFESLTLKTTGLGESMVEEKIDAPLRPLVEAGLELGYCAHYGEVDVRLAARGVQAREIVRRAEAIVRKELGGRVFGVQDDRLNEIVVRLMMERKQTLVLAESCTGGYVANRITDVPGASEIFLCGMVTYSNESKRQLLEVRAETLEQHGAVSEATAREMAEGARKKFGADYAIAITGIAGPGGGTPEKPVGTVFIALASAHHTFVLNPVNRFERTLFKQVTCQQALDLLRRTLLKSA